MPVYEQGYQRWNGELQERPLRWWPIVRQGVMAFLPQRKYLAILVIAWIQKIWAGAQLFTYLRGRDLVEGVAQTLGVGAGRFDPGSAHFWGVQSDSMLWIVIFTIMVGSDLIASDRRGKALQLYFSKPITPNDYILGKAGVIGVFHLLANWVPTMLLWVFALMLEPTGEYFGRIWAVPLVLTVHTLLVFAVAALLMLVASASAQRTIFIAVTWIILFGVAIEGFNPIIEMMVAITDVEAWRLLSMDRNLDTVGAWMFGVGSDATLHPSLSLVALLAVIAGAYAWVRRKIRPVEVVL